MWQIRSNVKVKRVCHKCEKFEPICHTCVESVRIFHSCDKYVRMKDSHEFFTSVIRTHDMCDKFIKISICNAFIFTAAYHPKHNIVLWKEKCWGYIRLILRSLGIGRIRRWVSRLNRNLFCVSVKHEKSGNVRQPFIHFPINVSLILKPDSQYNKENQRWPTADSLWYLHNWTLILTKI